MRPRRRRPPTRAQAFQRERQFATKGKLYGTISALNRLLRRTYLTSAERHDIKWAMDILETLVTNYDDSTALLKERLDGPHPVQQ